MAKRKTYTREEALEWMAQGHKARPPGWGYNQWLRAHNVHGYVDDSGTPMPHRPEMLAASDATGWTLLGRRRVERERRIAELEAELDAMTSAADRQRERAKTAEAELADLRTKLAAAEAGRPRFQQGDRVQLRSGSLATVFRREVSYDLIVDLTGGQVQYGYSEDGLQPAPEPQPEPEWVACSAAEAREKHAAGMRVRHCTWKPHVWCFGGRPSVASSDMAMWVLANLDGSNDWLWSHPLPGSGT